MPSLSHNYITPGINFNGIASGALGVAADVPRGPLYKALDVWATNAAGVLTDATTIIGKLRLQMGTALLREFTPSQAIRYLKLYGFTPATGNVPIPFSLPWLTNKALAESFAWDTFGQPGKFTLSADFLAPGGGVGIQSVDSETAIGRNVTSKNTPFLKIRKWKIENAAIGGAGTVNVTTLDNSLPIKALLIDASAGNITDLEIIAGGVTVFKSSRVRWNDKLVRYRLDGTQFGYAWLSDYDGSDHKIPAGQDLIVKITADAAAQFTILNIQQNDRYA